VGNPSSSPLIVDVVVVVAMAQRIHTSRGNGDDAIVKLHRVEKIHLQRVLGDIGFIITKFMVGW